MSVREHSSPLRKYLLVLILISLLLSIRISLTFQRQSGGVLGKRNARHEDCQGLFAVDASASHVVQEESSHNQVNESFHLRVAIYGFENHNSTVSD
jgi:hypothetical protein